MSKLWLIGLAASAAWTTAAAAHPAPPAPPASPPPPVPYGVHAPMPPAHPGDRGMAMHHGDMDEADLYDMEGYDEDDMAYGDVRVHRMPREWDGEGDGHRRIVRVFRHGDGPSSGCRGDRCPPMRPMRRMAPPAYPYGYPYGYGYGYGCGCGAVVITETTTTTAPVVETRTYYETVTERVAPRRIYRKPAPRRAAPSKVLPRSGERG